jgi:endonuclease/exonuclease/phosphatase family metal-dependent hydrolase
MRFSILLAALFVGCTDAAVEPSEPVTPFIEVVGRLENKKLDEASGLARSYRSPGTFWSINDDGSSDIYAIDGEGKHLGKVRIKDASNKDWEDLASFELDGEPYLLVAGIGDNEARRKKRSLYVIKEPRPDKKKVDVEWRIDFSYENGPRDAEAIAVDVINERVLLLSKRDIPAVLYELPLRPEGDEFVEARPLGPVASLPQPTQRDRANALALKDWFWQPTGMDIAPDGSFAVILTYAGVYFYGREQNESWLDALSRAPLEASLGKLGNAESIAISNDGKYVYVTVEKKHAPLLRIDLARRPTDVTLMTFNVENLFDNADDPGKDDKAYLPIEAKQSEQHKAECNRIEVEKWRNECLYLDWSDRAIDYKLGVLADAIQQVGDGRGPDVLVFQEVENVNILEQLRGRLAASDYNPPVLLEGDDARGIDVAFMSRLPLLGNAVLRAASFEQFGDRARDTRDILEATFELPDGSKLTGFAVHFPAPYHPTEMRVVAYEHLAQLRAALPADHHAFAAGDFNTTSTEDEQQGMLQRLVRPHWQIAHENGCEECRGTYYYAPDDNWSFLDMILFSPGSGAKTTWQIRADSAWIGNRSEAQVTLSGTPAGFDGNKLRGVSDHWPVVVTIESD